MALVFGLALVMVLVFGGYILSGGSMGVILHALPYEGMIVAGAAIGALVIGNSMGTLVKIGRGVGMVLWGPRWKASDYTDLLQLMYDLCQLRRSDFMKLEEHIENPDSSSLIAQYPRLRDSQPVMDMIRDSFRLISMQFDDPMETEIVLDRRLAKRKKESMSAVKALDTMADALPAIGIIAAVLGVIKTMAVVDQSPKVLGEMIAGALTGTFLGVFLAYCLVAPIANRLRQIEEQDAQLFVVIRDVIVAMVANHPPNVAVEIGRNSIPSSMQPDFEAVEDIARQPVAA